MTQEVLKDIRREQHVDGRQLFYYHQPVILVDELPEDYRDRTLDTFKINHEVVTRTTPTELNFYRTYDWLICNAPLEDIRILSSTPEKTFKQLAKMGYVFMPTRSISDITGIAPMIVALSKSQEGGRE